MSYASAKSHIVSIISNVRPTARAQDLGQRFSFKPDGRSVGANSKGNVSRGFWVRTTDGATVGPFIRGNLMSRTTMVLTIVYRVAGTVDDYDTYLEQDRIDITKALLDETLWGRPNSGIINIATGDALILPFSRDEVDEGVVEMNITITLTFI